MDVSLLIRICLSAVAKTENIGSPLQAEINAILFGLQLVKEMNVPNVHVESDSLIAIIEITKKNDSFCQWDCLLSDILELSLEFNSCFFSHVSRYANTFAHNIAKVQCQLGEHKIWRNSLPQSLCNPDVFMS